MIPLQVRMKGWMRYRDEEVADFSGGNLISICGENGGGKSSIFDAITYALYGKHRLGQMATEELISQDEDASWVEFDFELAGDRWRVHRGRSRGTQARTSGRAQPGATTHSLYRFDPGSEIWLLVPNSDSAATLQRAIDGILHMSEQAFTSSFLLQQGEATQFLDAKPAERFKIISSLIGLEAYERLAKLANEAARTERVRVQDIGRSLEALADVTNTTVADYKEAWRQAQEDLQRAQADVATAGGRAGDAARFAARSAEIEVLRLRIEEADALIAEKTQIEEQARTYEGLVAAVETLSRLNAALSEAALLQDEADSARKRAQAIDLVAMEDALAQARRASEEAKTALTQAEATLAASTAGERAAYDFLLIADAVTTARARLEGKLEECRRLSADLAGLEEARADAESLAVLARAVPPLTAYAATLQKVEALAKAEPARELEQAVSQGDALLARASGAEEALAACEEALRLARDAHAAARTRMADAREQLKQRQDASGETVCSRCGQPVTEEHRKAEIAESQARLSEAVAEAQRCLEAEKQATTAHTSARDAAARIKAEAEALNRTILRLQQQADALAQANEEMTQARESFIALAPPDLRKRVVKQDGAAIATVLIELADAPARESAASRRYQALLGIEGQLAAVQRDVMAAQSQVSEAEARAGDLLMEVAGAVAAHDEAKACLEDAAHARDAAAAQLQALLSCASAADSAHSEGRQEHARLQAQAAQKDAEVNGCLSTAKAYAQALPVAMQTRALQDAEAVLSEVQQAKAGMEAAPARLSHLRQAEQSRAGWEGERRSKEAEIADMPESHRIPVEQAEAELRAAERASTAAAEGAQEMAAELAKFEERLRHKHDLEERSEKAKHRQRLYTKLSRLLGKGGLQGALVTNALDQITNHANTFLKHLTGGSLVMELHKGSGADELDLRAIDTTCMREARSVQALSGSQKFRCAVAVAMGIGQYAGGRMRSIVIDEGFGSLDDIGQAQMVDELKNLAQSMDRVIVVSHLDMFRDRDNFPYQLHVEKAGMASHIKLVV